MALSYMQRMILAGIGVGIVIGLVVGGIGSYLGLSAGIRGGVTGALTVIALQRLRKSMKQDSGQY